MLTLISSVTVTVSIRLKRLSIPTFILQYVKIGVQKLKHFSRKRWIDYLSGYSFQSSIENIQSFDSSLVGAHIWISG